MASLGGDYLVVYSYKRGSLSWWGLFSSYILIRGVASLGWDYLVVYTYKRGGLSWWGLFRSFILSQCFWNLTLTSGVIFVGHGLITGETTVPHFIFI